MATKSSVVTSPVQLTPLPGGNPSLTPLFTHSPLMCAIGTWEKEISVILNRDLWNPETIPKDMFVRLISDAKISAIHQEIIRKTQEAWRSLSPTDQKKFPNFLEEGPSPSTLRPQALNDLLRIADEGRLLSLLQAATDSPEKPFDATTCNLSRRSIEALPFAIGGLRHLSLLNLSFNSLTSLPLSLRNIPSLLDVNLASNCLTEVPPVICTLQSLVRLDLSFNKIQEIPCHIGNCTNLQELDLHANHLRDVSPALETLHLTKLVLTANANLRCSSECISLLLRLREKGCVVVVDPHLEYLMNRK